MGIAARSRVSPGGLSPGDRFRRWLEERCVVSDRIGFTRTSSLYDDWSAWRERHGSRPGGMRAFSRLLRRHGFRPGTRRNAAGFAGLGLRAEPAYEEEFERQGRLGEQPVSDEQGETPPC